MLEAAHAGLPLKSSEFILLPLIHNVNLRSLSRTLGLDGLHLTYSSLLLRNRLTFHVIKGMDFHNTWVFFRSCQVLRTIGPPSLFKEYIVLKIYLQYCTLPPALRTPSGEKYRLELFVVSATCTMARKQSRLVLKQLLLTR